MDLWGDFYLKKRIRPLSQTAKITAYFSCIPNTFYLKKVETLRNQHVLYPLFDTKTIQKNVFSEKNAVFLKRDFNSHILLT